MRKIPAFLLATILLLGHVSDVWAVRYVFDEGHSNNYIDSQIITDPQILTYVYGLLTPGADKIDFYSLPFTQPAEGVTISILVTQDEFNKGFKPNFAFVDPQFPTRNGDVPITFPPHLAARVYDWQTVATETFTNTKVFTKFVVGPHMVRSLSNKTYTLGIFDSSGRGGRYVVKIGATEKPDTLVDSLMFFVSFARIKLSLY